MCLYILMLVFNVVVLLYQPLVSSFVADNDLYKKHMHVCGSEWLFWGEDTKSIVLAGSFSPDDMSAEASSARLMAYASESRGICNMKKIGGSLMFASGVCQTTNRRASIVPFSGNGLHVLEKATPGIITKMSLFCLLHFYIFIM